ncbi:MAG: DUF1592 domain-containing protein [Deltaproteobacteria bacterium]|jgi:hypothetical protein
MARIHTLLVSLVVASCTGPAEAPPPVPDDPTPPPPDEPYVPEFAPAEARLHRLTLRQYRNSVRDLLGPVDVPEDLEVDTPLHSFTTVGASNLTIGPRAAEQYEAAARDLAAQVFTPDRREGFVGCAPADAADPCVRAFLERFGGQVFRRPLDVEQLDRWSAVIADVEDRLGSVWAALEMTTAGLLMSPQFLFRVDVGVPEGGRLRYDGYEMAARLSYFLWSSTPDDALLAAAADGTLDSAAGIEREARRLLADPRARDALLAFFSEHLKLERLDTIDKDPALFPQMSPTLGESMRQELLLMIDDIVFERDADLRTIFDTDTTFVNPELARLYQVPASFVGEEFVKVQFAENSPRAGILTSGAFLALNAHATLTSPTLRGRFVRQSLLCQDIPAPPPTVNTTIPAQDPNVGPETLRQRLERLHLAEPTCAGCHNRMDPLGFALEAFDAIGAYRTTDNGIAVDTRGSLDGLPFKDAKGLGGILRERREVAACMAQMTYRYASGHLETRGEVAVLYELADAFEASDFSFTELVVAIVRSDGFRYAGVEQ